MTDNPIQPEPVQNPPPLAEEQAPRVMEVDCAAQAAMIEAALPLTFSASQLPVRS